jgi:hypothetical protein
MQTLVLYALVTAAAHYLLGFASITNPARKHLPDAVLRWLYCPFCSGFWYGLAFAITVGRHQDLALLGLPGRLWYTPIVAAVISSITTPIVRGIAFSQLVASHTAMDAMDAAAPKPDAAPPDLRAV